MKNIRCSRFLFLTLTATFAFSLEINAQEPILGSQQIDLPDVYFQNADGFVPECHEAFPGWLVTDPEFNQDELLAVWKTGPTIKKDSTIKTHGSVFITPIDTLTGDFYSVGQVQINEANPVPRGTVINGPEWANSQRGWEIYYSCYTADLKRVRLCRISRDQGEWRVFPLLASDGIGARNPSKNSILPAPNLYYQHYEGVWKGRAGLTKGNFGWRQDIENPTDTILSSDIGQGRWMPDGERIVHIKAVRQNGNSIKQLAIYNTTTQEDRLIFFDGRNRRDPFPWEAPELGGKLALVAVVEKLENNSWDVEVYREDGQENWITWNVFTPIHKNFRASFSPESFIFQEKSYVSAVSYLGSDFLGNPSIIWIASVNPDLPETDKVRRIISREINFSHQPSLFSVKGDPESLVIRNGKQVRVYYVDHVSNSKKSSESTPRLMNCDTGLTVP